MPEWRNWSTRTTQNRVKVTSCGFESHLWHLNFLLNLKEKLNRLRRLGSFYYAIGLIVTDGSLSSDGRHIIFSSKDIELIHEFKKIMLINNKIGNVKNGSGKISHRVQFCNKILYRYFNRIGIKPNKTFILKSIKIPKRFFIDFLRGHLDGDGSITTYIDKYNTFKNKKYVYNRLFVRFISASKDHIEWLNKMIVNNLGIRGSIHKSKTTEKIKNPMYIIKFGKKDSLLLLSKIYYSNEIPYLKRKYDIYYKFINK